MWEPAIIQRPGDCLAALTAVAGDKYSYRDLEDYTDLIKRTLQRLPQVSKITRTGVLNEQINLEFSQERLAAYAIQPVDFRARLQSRNILSSGGVLAVQGKNSPVRPSGEFTKEADIGKVFVTTSQPGNPVYLRDLVDISRDYESPARFLNFLTWRDSKDNWQRTRAVTMAVFMRNREHIGRVRRLNGDGSTIWIPRIHGCS